MYPRSSEEARVRLVVVRVARLLDRCVFALPARAGSDPLVAETKAEEQVELPVTWVPKDSAPALEAAA